MTSPCWYKMSEAAKILDIKGIGRNNLVRILKHEGLLNGQNMPANWLLEQGLFSFYNWQINTNRFTYTPVVSAEGIELLRKLITK